MSEKEGECKKRIEELFEQLDTVHEEMQDGFEEIVEDAEQEFPTTSLLNDVITICEKQLPDSDSGSKRLVIFTLKKTLEAKQKWFGE